MLPAHHDPFFGLHARGDVPHHDLDIYLIAKLDAAQRHIGIEGGFILADVSEIHYDRGHGFTLYTTAGALPVKIGTDDFDKKLQRFARIYQNLMSRGCSILTWTTATGLWSKRVKQTV